ncbi:MAG: ATP-dependent helicase [Anaerolineae bacterium]|nr:ATP-dependent helicase [Anaerolineae bacterium]
MEFQPRSAQKAVLAYRGGKIGVAAVPGSGKTWTLSRLAADLIAEGYVGDDQEILVVTLVNSAVSNFASRVGSFVQEAGLLPNLGYRVRTLHGLCHDIVRERPALAGLANDFQIIDEREAEEVLRDAAEAWLRAHPQALDDYLLPDMDESKAGWIRREQLPPMVVSLATSFIKKAKDLQFTPAELRYYLDHFDMSLPLVEMGAEIYTDYQRALSYRGKVDFDDLIRLALQALQLDPEFLLRLRRRWPFILEDEAQDSSRLQESILRLLCGAEGNWVRVGDPNQAIYETFTTANPRYLHDFIEEKDVTGMNLPDSGRSTRSIIDLANQLSDWTQTSHPVTRVRGALSLPKIRAVPANDPQPNPQDAPERILLSLKRFTPQEEIEAVITSVSRWVATQAECTDVSERETCAILVPRNQRGFEIVEALKQQEIPYIELLRSTRSTRETAGALGNIIAYLADPTSTTKLATTYRVWRRQDRQNGELKAQLEWVNRQLHKCRQVEDFLWPRAGRDWLETLDLETEHPQIHTQLLEFRAQVQRWQAAANLPIDQLILTLAQDLCTEPADLAIAHKLALVVRRAANQHPEWRLPELTQELAVIARNERKFLGLSEDDTGFEPQKYRGQVVVSTVHKAKGLEWDRVYLMSVSTYDYPSALAGDSFISEKWYVRDKLNLEAEALAQLQALRDDPTLFFYDEGQPTQGARYDYAAERVRLFYVGITRAKKALVVTWNTGKRGDQHPAAPLIALETWWQEHLQSQEATSLDA